ncbi:hypothetical protein EV182_007069, partial [Spiromyces aspiralis]
TPTGDHWLDYNGKLEAIRRAEYPQLYVPPLLPSIAIDTSSADEPKLKTIYLDHTGTTLYASSHIRAHTEALLRDFPANPHSGHPLARETGARIDQIRSRVHEFFGVPESDYALIFTSGATAGIRL